MGGVQSFGFVPLNCVGTSLRMTGTAGGTVPAYQETMHSNVPAYAGSNYSPKPIVILSATPVALFQRGVVEGSHGAGAVYTKDIADAGKR